MIAYLEGILIQKEPTFVILDVGGVGYQVRIALPTFSALEVGKRSKLQTYLLIREDAHTLYGFLDIVEKKLFLDLLSVSGVGANTAMLILSSLSTSEIQSAIVNEKVNVIQSVKGIGLKTAQRLILELKDKIKKENLDAVGLVQAGSPSLAKSEALQALLALGLTKIMAEKNIETICKKHGDNLSVEEMIRYALKA
jgi:Holliday junction DNA helicase RuvA